MSGSTFVVSNPLGPPVLRRFPSLTLLSSRFSIFVHSASATSLRCACPGVIVIGEESANLAGFRQAFSLVALISTIYNCDRATSGRNFPLVD